MTLVSPPNPQRQSTPLPSHPSFTFTPSPSKTCRRSPGVSVYVTPRDIRCISLVSVLVGPIQTRVRLLLAVRLRILPFGNPTHNGRVHLFNYESSHSRYWVPERYDSRTFLLHQSGCPSTHDPRFRYTVIDLFWVMEDVRCRRLLFVSDSSLSFTPVITLWRTQSLGSFW